MSRVVRQMAENIESSGKYAFMSYYNTRFSAGGDVSRFHLEARYCDGMMSPTAIAASGVLLYALLMMAVSLSQYGIMHSGSSGYLDQAYTIQQNLLNNDGSYQGPRHSNTSRFEPYMETVRREASEMVTLLHNELRKHGPAYEVLQKLAEKPCSLRLIEGDSWEKIEDDLSGRHKQITPVEAKILEAVDTFYIDDCVDANEWLDALSEDSGSAAETVKKAAQELTEAHIIMWDSVVGAYVRC